MRLWLLRHARVLLAPGLCYGASDVPADPALTQQAAQAAAACLPPGLPVFCSALGRAGALAQALRALRPDLGAPQTDARLNEMDFGRWEQVPWDAIPRAAFEAWMADFAHHRFGGAESTQQVIGRVAGALAAQRRAGVREAVWVSHAGVIRAAQYVARQGHRPIASAQEWPREAPEPGQWLQLDI